jgi:hypothetical protein
MIVTPDKGIFFVATALMCSASLYGAELTSAGTDPMTRIFVGQPNLLTLPPGFPPDIATADAADCAPPRLGTEAALQTVTAKAETARADEAGCSERELKPVTSESPLRLPLDVANAKGDIPFQPISAGSAAQAH